MLVSLSLVSFAIGDEVEVFAAVGVSTFPATTGDSLIALDFGFVFDLVGAKEIVVFEVVKSLPHLPKAQDHVRFPTRSDEPRILRQLRLVRVAQVVRKRRSHP